MIPDIRKEAKVKKYEIDLKNTQTLALVSLILMIAFTIVCTCKS